MMPPAFLGTEEVPGRNLIKFFEGGRAGRPGGGRRGLRWNLNCPDPRRVPNQRGLACSLLVVRRAHGQLEGHCRAQPEAESDTGSRTDMIVLVTANRKTWHTP